MRKLTGRKTILIAVSLTLLLGGLYFIEKLSYGIRLNRSSSLPYKLFISSPLKQIKRYDYVCFHHPACCYPLAKQIIGMPGDQITLKDDCIFINDYDCGRAFNFTSLGLTLTPITTCKIPEGYVFLHASHPESFDSRYQQFGLIKIEQLKEVLWPIY